MSLKFTLKLKTLPVELDEKQYTLTELTGQQRDAYLNVSANRVKMDEKGKVTGIKNFDGLQTHLLSLSMRDPQGQLVLETEIKGWPSTVVEALYAESQKLSGLATGKEAGEEAAKNV